MFLAGRKRDVKDVPELAEYCALCSDMIKELKQSGLYSAEIIAKVQEDAELQHLWLHSAIARWRENVHQCIMGPLQREAFTFAVASIFPR